MGYFKVYPIAKKTWYIKEPLGVGSFLFEGDDAALLLDTCNGFRDIRKTVGRLCPKPLTVLNSHGHADHAGGNDQFREVYIHAADLPMLTPEYLQSQRNRLFGYVKQHYPLVRPLLWWLGHAKHERFPTQIKTCADGHRFDLGGRVLTAIHCPGHSPGSLVLTDACSQTLYAADAVNPGLFLFFEDSPTLTDYAREIRKLSAVTGLTQLRISHSAEPLPFRFISWYADFLERAGLEQSQLTNIPNGDNPVYKYTENGKDFNLTEITVHFTKNQI